MKKNKANQANEVSETNEVSHTPTLPEPRAVANNGWQIQFPNQPLVFTDKELAFKIVRAVNAHETLLEAAIQLKKFAWANDPNTFSPELQTIINLASNAITLAKNGK